MEEKLESLRRYLKRISDKRPGTAAELENDPDLQYRYAESLAGGAGLRRYRRSSDRRPGLSTPSDHGSNLRSTG